ncbi:hypothetical protein CEXT_276461 [Caerostris extrusa]|uniref:Uncharacterized protein n=1 Tax=Caerostris extrusa TaxID=172846 RepID=A0AAV4PCE2_CAEEX|nr:hypothetical protein CEXT_276461 [Caerostris extrusa]
MIHQKRAVFKTDAKFGTKFAIEKGETLKYGSILKYSSPIFAHDRLSTWKKEIQRERKTFCIYCRHKITTKEIQNPNRTHSFEKKGMWGGMGKEEFFQRSIFIFHFNQFRTSEPESSRVELL